MKPPNQRTPSLKKQLGITILIFSILQFFLQIHPLVKDIEERFQSNFYLFQSYFAPVEERQSSIILVLIDDNSLSDGVRSPISRSWLAGVVKGISQKGAKLIVMDFLFDRPSIEDQRLLNQIKDSGNVVLKDDGIYPVLPTFRKAATAVGGLTFRFDSSGALQAFCNHPSSCNSPQVLLKEISNLLLLKEVSENSWEKLVYRTYSNPERESLFNFPILRPHELNELPANAFKGKIVLLGTGFPDLYPLFRTPLPYKEKELQEVEILAHMIDMRLSSRSFGEFPSWVFSLFFLLSLLALSWFLLRAKPGSALIFFLGMVIGIYILASTLFAGYYLILPYLLPLSLLLIFLLIAYSIVSIDERFQVYHMQLSLKQTKIDFLTNELHSHHLFNELSRVSVMIRQAPKAAREYLVEFAEMLHTSMKFADQSRVPLQDQIEYVRSYLRQQEIIYGDQMEFSFEIKGDYNQVKAIWHLLFPLVENAVKYSELILKAGKSSRIKIQLFLSRNNGSLQFKIINPFQHEIQAISTKKGLENLKNRLSMAYKNQYRLHYHAEKEFWIATLEIPFP